MTRCHVSNILIDFQTATTADISAPLGCDKPWFPLFLLYFLQSLTALQMLRHFWLLFVINSQNSSPDSPGGSCGTRLSGRRRSYSDSCHSRVRCITHHTRSEHWSLGCSTDSSCKRQIFDFRSPDGLTGCCDFPIGAEACTNIFG